MTRSARLVLTAALLSLLGKTNLPASETAGQGLGWRGDGSGVFVNANPPIDWDCGTGKNILWRAKVGKGRSTPVAVANRVFITAEPEALLCLDRESGRILWRRDNASDVLPAQAESARERLSASPDCGYAAPTPLVDGKSVYTVFGTGTVASYDFEGKRQWVHVIDARLTTEYGRSASPRLAGGRLLVSVAGLTALDAQTGEILWDAPAAKAAYGTPALMKLGDVDLIITPRGDCVRLSDGRILATKLAKMKYTSPLVVKDVVYFADGPTAAYKLALRADGTLEPTKLWESPDVEGEFFASPVLEAAILYCVSNQGILYAVDAASGQLRWKQELDIRSAAAKTTEPANIYPSLTLAGVHLLVGNDVGELLVLKPGGKYEQVSRTTLGSGSGATPLPDGNTLFLRGIYMLYRIGPPGSPADR